MQISEPVQNADTQETAPDINGLLSIDYHNIKKAALILRSLNHKLRQQILRIINEDNRITVTEIYVKLRLEQSVASQHLAILRKAGIVSTQREGKFIFYGINTLRVEAVQKFVNDLVG
ncbi:MAG: metalloregulator ArsR/SmtB family transcription factor [Ginsengibacter sp.]